MKRGRGFSCLLLLLCLLLCVPALSLAADGQDKEQGGGYTYTVRIYAGNQGVYQGETVIEIPGCSPGQQILFNLRDVQLADNSKYYVKGIRESGRDDAARSAFTVEGDADYVIVYGVLGNMTSYVINYVDAAGNALAPQETYYGNVGDKPVIAYLYIEGYQPQAYNLTKTLSENAAENVFTFVYAPLETAGPAVTPPAQETSAADAEETEPGTTGAEATGETDAADAETETTEADTTDETNDDTQIDDDPLPLGEPEEIQDLDIEDEQLPLANDRSEDNILTSIIGDAELLGVPLGIVILASVLIAGVLLWFGLAYWKRKKREES